MSNVAVAQCIHCAWPQAPTNSSRKWLDGGYWAEARRRGSRLVKALVGHFLGLHLTGACWDLVNADPIVWQPFYCT